MAGKFPRNEISWIGLDTTPQVPVVPASGVAIVAWDPLASSIALTYVGQQGTYKFTVPRTETLTLAQNVFGGVPVTIPAQSVVGTIYLPAGGLNAGSSAYLTVTDGQTPAELSVQIQPAGTQTITASFLLTMVTPGSLSQSIPIQVFTPTIPSGWYDVVAGLTTQTAAGLINGIYLSIDPNP